jgi:EmrB/QacA subfamily drug resistance transporter
MAENLSPAEPAPAGEVQSPGGGTGPASLSDRRRRVATAAIVFGMFAAAIEMTIVSTAMPRAAGDLGGSDRYAWVLSIYLLSSTVSAPLFGKLADLFGRRPSYLAGMSLFLLGSWASGAAWSMTALIVARAVQGVGGGALATVGLTVVGDLYPAEQRGKVQGLFSAVWGFAGAIGPVAGGLIVDYLSWRWVFYLNVPFGLLAMGLLAGSLREGVARKRVQIDWLGALLLAGAIVAIQLGSGAHGVAGMGRAPLVVGLALAVAFVFVERRAKEPVLPLELFAHKTITVAVLVTLASGVVMTVVTNYVPLLLQGAQGATTRESGLVMTAFAIGWPVAAFSVGMLLARVGVRRAAIAGFSLVFLGALWLATANIHTGRPALVLASGLIGVGMGLQSTPLLIAVQTTVPWNLRGAATASFSFSRTLGGTLGAILAGALAEQRLHARGVASATIDAALRPGAPLASLVVREAIADVVHAALVANAVVALCALVLSRETPAGTLAARKAP